MLRKIVTKIPKRANVVAANNFIVKNKSNVVLARSLSDMTDKRKGEESKYFRQQEENRLNDMRAQMEAILKSDDAEKKEDLLELLATKKDEDQGIISKLGLDDWKVAVPIGVICAIPVMKNEILMINEEFTLAAVFMVFCSTVYVNLSGMIGKSIDSETAAIANSLKNVDEVLLEEITESVKANKEILDLEQDIKDVNALIDDLSSAKAQALTQGEVHQFRDEIAKKLDALVALEEKVTGAVRTRMLNKVRSDVIASFTSDKKAKENALNQAIAVLSAGPNAKLGKDVVGESFAAAIKTYKDDYAKAKGPDEIISTLEKDMASIAVAPVPSSAGGNVYTVSPVN